MRRVLFLVHLWLGILLGLYTAVIGLTGSALVFRMAIERAVAPGLFAVSAGNGPHAALAPLLQRVAQRYPGEPIDGIDQLEQDGEPAIVYLTAPGGEQRMVYADQATGRILGSQLRYAGVLGVCANLHYYLLAGQTGYIVNGVCACAFLLLCCTGWLLWWPGRRSVRHGLRVHWRARWKRLNWDLHTVGGFWSNPLLIAVIATGILFVFPKPVFGALGWLGGGHAAAAWEWLSSPAAPARSGPTITPDSALARAQAALVAHGSADRVRYLAVPSAASAVYDAIAYPSRGADYAMPAYVYLDAHTGALLALKDARALPRPMQWATYAYAVHFGSFGGWFTKVVWVLLGLMPAGLWGTGLLLWWNRELRQRFRVA